MRVLKGMIDKLFRTSEDMAAYKDVTVEQQKKYEKELKERARTGRIVTLTVCLLNLFVTGIIGLTGMGWILSGFALAGIVFSLKGRMLGRAFHLGVDIILAMIGYSVVLALSFGGAEEYGSFEMLYRFISIYGAVTCVFMLRSKLIGSWFEYAGSYKCRYLGKRFFE